MPSRWIRELFGVKFGENFPRDEVQTFRQIGALPAINTNEAPLDIWDLKQPFIILPEDGSPLQISSSNTLDVTEPISILGLNEDGIRTAEIVILNGQNAVNLDNRYSFVYSLVHLGPVELVGQVYLSTQGDALTAGVPTDILDTVMTIQGGNRSFSSFFKVPRNAQFCFITQLVVSLSKGGGASTRSAAISLQIKPDPAIVFNDFIFFTPSLHGMPQLEIEPKPPGSISPDTTIKYTVSALSDNNTGVQGATSLVVIPKRT